MKIYVLCDLEGTAGRERHPASGLEGCAATPLSVDRRIRTAAG